MSIYDLKVKNRNNEDVYLEYLKGKVLLVVNTAVGRYSPTYKPEDMEDKIKELIG